MVMTILYFINSAFAWIYLHTYNLYTSAYLYFMYCVAILSIKKRKHTYVLLDSYLYKSDPNQTHLRGDRGVILANADPFIKVYYKYSSRKTCTTLKEWLIYCGYSDPRWVYIKYMSGRETRAAYIDLVNKVERLTNNDIINNDISLDNVPSTVLINDTLST